MIKANAFGSLAWEALQGRWKADVMGVTSGGVFLRANRERILFVTYSPYHSPITINLGWETRVDLQENQVGAAAFLDPTRITIPSSNLAVWLEGAQLWNPGLPGEIVELDGAMICERLRRVSLSAVEKKGPQGFGPFIRRLFGDEISPMNGDLNEELGRALSEAYNAVRQGDFGLVITLARSWVGYGRGLTPAGDDCLAGILLVLNRWGRPLGLVEDIGPINQSAISLAKERTTLLSSTIIQSAALGLADERILRVLDGILLGEPAEAEGVDALVRMGHSSGVDTLAGCALVLSGLLAKTCVPGG